MQVEASLVHCQKMVMKVSHLRGHKDSVNYLASAKNDEVDPVIRATIASGSDDSTVRIWDTRSAQTAKCIAKVFDGEPVNALLFTKGHTIQVAAGANIYEFDLRQERLILTKASHCMAFNMDEVNSLSQHPEKPNLMASTDDSGEIKIIDLETHGLEKTLRSGHSNICVTAEFRPKAAWDLVSGGFDSSLVFWYA